MKFSGLIFLFFIPLLVAAQKNDPASSYRLLDDEGERIGYGGLLERADDADLVFFGELHDDPIGHWLQLRLAKALYERKGDSLRLGAEMFEAPDQLLLNEYLNGTVRMKDLKRTAKLWDNFDTDYRPLLEFARDKGVPFLASNVPRRYASLIMREGRSALDSLDEEAYRYMDEDFVLDTSLASYKRVMKMGGVHGPKGKRMAMAQALKDATMAERIAERYEEGISFLHFNGSFHSDAHEGIVHYLGERLPEAEVLVISSIRVKELDAPNDMHLDRKGDINLLIPEDMTRTH